jgi:hypothetical protein
MKWLRSIARLLGVARPSQDKVGNFRSGMFPDHGLPLIPLDSVRGTEIEIYLPNSNEEYEVLKKKRASVQRKLTKEINALLEPLGYERTGSEWRKKSRFGRSYFGFQKSHYGFGCFFNAGTLGKLEVPSQTRANTIDGIQCHRIAEFCPEMPHNDVADELPYVRLHDDTGFCNGVTTVIRARMIPWMEARHKAFAMIRMPSPADMVAVKIFLEHGEP